MWGHSQLSAPGPASFKMSTVHETVRAQLRRWPLYTTKCIRYRSVKAHTNFDADQDALNIEMAVKTKGVAELTVVNILANRSNEQTGHCLCLPEKDQKGTASVLKTALSSHLETVILGLLKTRARYDASKLRTPWRGWGLMKALTEIICSRTNQGLQEINSLQGNVQAGGHCFHDTSGDFCKLMVALGKGKSRRWLCHWSWTDWPRCPESVSCWSEEERNWCFQVDQQHDRVEHVTSR